MELIGCVIAELREARGWSRTEFAGMIGRSPFWLTKIETGERTIRDLDDLRPIAAALGMDESDLLAAAGQDLDAFAFLPEAVQALSIAAGTAAARAYLVPVRPVRGLAELTEGVGLAKRHLNGARPVDAAGVLAEIIVELEHAAVAGDGGRIKANNGTTALIEAYQVAALVLSHTGDHDTAQVIAHAGSYRAHLTGRPTLPPALTATCVYRRANSAILATAMAETVLTPSADPPSKRQQTALSGAPSGLS